MKKIKLTKNMGHTWFVDLDGTILKHNGYILDKKDTLLKGVKKFFSQIPKKRIVAILRTLEDIFFRELTLGIGRILLSTDVQIRAKI